MWFNATAPVGTLLLLGQTVKQKVFPVLFGLYGSTFNTGGEAADEFRLPDPQGRALVGVGTNADVNALGDNDGVALASRTPKHNTTGSVSSHSHAAGTLAVSPDPHSHTEARGGGNTTTPGGSIGVPDTTTGSTNSTSLSITGSTSPATPSFTGIGGTRPNDLTPWLAVYFGVVAG